jgi:soluble lytic murein transglycosylase
MLWRKGYWRRTFRGAEMGDERYLAGSHREETTRETDTVEYETRVLRRRARNSLSVNGPSANRGYWLDAGDGVAPAAGSQADAGTQRAIRGGDAAGRRRPSRSRRGLGIVVALVLIAVAVVVAVLLVTGRTVVPVLSERLFPIHYQDEISRIAGKYGQDPYLVAAVTKAESGYDAQATSGKGAVGLMQLMPDTAEWIASKLAWPEGGPVLTDPADNLELGVWYLDYLGVLYGDGTPATLAAYNAGPGNVEEWIETAGGLEAFDLAAIEFPETREYVERVAHFYQLYRRIHPDVFTAE